MSIPTRSELAALLKTVSVAEVARRSNLASKTIYRLRNEKNSPTLDTTLALVAAVEEIHAEAKRSRRKVA